MQRKQISESTYNNLRANFLYSIDQHFDFRNSKKEKKIIVAMECESDKNWDESNCKTYKIEKTSKSNSTFDLDCYVFNSHAQEWEKILNFDYEKAENKDLDRYKENLFNKFKQEMQEKYEVKKDKQEQATLNNQLCELTYKLEKQYGILDEIKDLISQGADVNAKFPNGDSVFHKIIEYSIGIENEEKYKNEINFFIEKGADINAINSKEKTILDTVNDYIFPSDVKNIKDFLIEKGAKTKEQILDEKMEKLAQEYGYSIKKQTQPAPLIDKNKKIEEAKNVIKETKDVIKQVFKERHQNGKTSLNLNRRSIQNMINSVRKLEYEIKQELKKQTTQQTQTKTPPTLQKSRGRGR